MRARKSRRHIYVLAEEGSLWSLRTLDGALAQRWWRKGPTKVHKAIAIEEAARFLVEAWFDFGQHSELRIRRENGTFAPARTYPRSSDPKRSRG